MRHRAAGCATPSRSGTVVHSQVARPSGPEKLLVRFALHPLPPLDPKPPLVEELVGLAAIMGGYTALLVGAGPALLMFVR